VLSWLNQTSELTKSSWACRWDTASSFNFKSKQIY